MYLKRIYVLIVFISVFSVFYNPLSAQKEQPPLSMKELQNPDGPSYVPIPYPKTREGIITDLEYIIERLFSDRKVTRSHGAPSEGRRILPRLLQEDSDLYVGRIVRSTSKGPGRANYYIIIDIQDISQTVVARISLEDSGLFAGAAFPGNFSFLKPLVDTTDLRELFSSNPIPSLPDIEVQSIEYERYIASSPTDFFIKITTNSGTLYMNRKENFFRIKGREKFSGPVSRLIPELMIDKRPRPCLIDTRNKEIIYLEKIR